MKNTVQVHRQGGTKAPSLQPKTRRQRVENPPAPVEAQENALLRRVRNAAQAVDEAAAMSKVLFELIANHLDAREYRQAENFTGQRADQFNFGLDLLTGNVSKELAESSAGIMAAAFPANKEVAS